MTLLNRHLRCISFGSVSAQRLLFVSLCLSSAHIYALLVKPTPAFFTRAAKNPTAAAMVQAPQTASSTLKTLAVIASPITLPISRSILTGLVSMVVH